MKWCGFIYGFVGVLDKVGIEPQIQRIGKYKSAGDRLARTDISDENRETLTALLDNIYGNWLDKVSLAKGTFALHSWVWLSSNRLFYLVSFYSCVGKKKEDIENFVNEGVYEVERLKEGCWITDIKYDDEVNYLSASSENYGPWKFAMFLTSWFAQFPNMPTFYSNKCFFKQRFDLRIFPYPVYLWESEAKPGCMAWTNPISQ